ncbi:hypothetical protein D3C75_1084270 [compost metagenome]
MQQDAVVTQQRDNNDFGLKLWIHKVLDTFFQVIDTDDSDTRYPQSYQCNNDRLLKTFHVSIIMLNEYFSP